MKPKTKVLLLVAIVLSAYQTFAQRGVRIAYVDMEYILENVEEYREATDQLENKVEKWKVEIEQKQSVVEQMKKDLMAEKVLLTNELIEEREEEILILEKEMIEYQQDRFGPQGDLVLQKRRLIQPIQDQVFNEVQKIGANKKYDFIFDKSADVVMLYSEKRHDISDLVLRGIARTRKISKPKKSDTKNRLSDFEGDDAPAEEEMSDALKERIELAKQAEEARAKTAEEKRAEQLKIREERKKAYDERRKKLLEEREAKKKAKEEERNKESDQEETEETK
ncbi:OmpH family outer membrane protein [Maribacter sp. TH_r10]|uniref:OmpH family outer membrane protein n=1 Tax=Maribacter luteus TaxID=2594478 RepID=A0A6I2ML05_9FLAO|nr:MULTISPECIES: OmpH family outer membrane protein [Maribacter]MDV7140238.1 OmpH family outer membrane protein [Maribacter sp. TH_r10]MRX63299.1 OmpH family outer membrane protein [Maribacter luteus]|tara:strand:- start:1783 stop:2622 length:840 start_codon:yes stop_codon:yes gene_type:complete